LLNKENVAKNVDIGMFYQGDNIPTNIVGLQSIGSTFLSSQKIVNNIRIETEKKIDLLRQVKSDLFNIERTIYNKHKTKKQKNKKKQNDYKLSFDQDKSAFFIGKNKVKIKKDGFEYHLLRIIFENKTDFTDGEP
jgi:uncharacterized membrane protein